jgi:hypothetical protein
MERRVTVTTIMILLICSAGYTQQVEQMIKAKPVGFSGSFDATTIFYGADGIPNRYLPFNYVITGSPTLSLYGIQIPFSFIIGKQQSSFTQPFNQFGLSPSYKWITLHAGYRNLTWSPLTLGGHTFLGAAVELNPGKFRLGAMYGQLNKATALDTTQTLYFSNFNYRRTGMAARIGYGTEQSFFDLIALKAKDEEGSLKGAHKGMADSLGVAPAENIVTGYNMKISLWKNRIIFESDGALSLYTNDIDALPVADSAYEKDIEKISRIVKVNTSSELYGAIQASIRYRSKFFSVRLQYRYIEPGYQSMGAYFLNNDLENYTIAPSFTAWKNRIRFNGSLGFQRDDLNGNKRAKARKVIGSANLSADLTQQLGLDLGFSNYSVNQSVKTIRFADSLKVVQSSRQISVMPRYTFSTGKLLHNILLAANLSQARELNPSRESALNADINTSNYMLTFQTNFPEAAASAYLSLNHTEMKSDLITDANHGLTIGGSKAWFRNKLNLSASTGYLLSKRNEEKGKILTGSVQAKYQFYGPHMLKLVGYYTGNRPDMNTAAYPRFTEWRVEAGYGFSF